MLRGAARTPNGEVVALLCVQRSPVPALSISVRGTSASCSLNVAVPTFGAPPDTFRNDARLKLRQLRIGLVYASRVIRNSSARNDGDGRWINVGARARGEERSGENPSAAAKNVRTRTIWTRLCGISRLFSTAQLTKKLLKLLTSRTVTLQLVLC